MAAPCIKNTLQRHPAYDASVKTLTAAGVTVLDPAATVTRSILGDVNFDWTAMLPD